MCIPAVGQFHLQVRHWEVHQPPHHVFTFVNTYGHCHVGCFVTMSTEKDLDLSHTCPLILTLALILFCSQLIVPFGFVAHPSLSYFWPLLYLCYSARPPSLAPHNNNSDAKILFNTCSPFQLLLSFICKLTHPHFLLTTCKIYVLLNSGVACTVYTITN